MRFFKWKTKKRVECSYCKGIFKESQVVAYGKSNYYCSQDCMCKHFGEITTEELLELENEDKFKLLRE